MSSLDCSIIALLTVSLTAFKSFPAKSLALFLVNSLTPNSVAFSADFFINLLACPNLVATRKP